MHGQFVWYELTTPDFEAAKKFYKPLTGWGTQQFDETYSMWTNGEQPVAGMFRLGDEQKAQGIPPNWMPYVEVNNVDESARLATSLGGKTMAGPDDVPGHGRFAVLQDPQGAVFGIYKANSGSNAWDGKPVVGRFSWHELTTTDWKGAFDFYRRLFGWEKTSEMDMGPDGGTYQMYGLQGVPFGGMMNRWAAMGDVPPNWLPYIYVKDVKKATELAKRSGAQVLNGPMEVPGGSWIVVLRDPAGAVVALNSPAPAARSVSAPKKAAKPKARSAKPKVRTAKKKSSKATARRKAKPAAKAKKSRPKARPRARAAKKKGRR